MDVGSITSEMMFPAVLAADPSFLPEWQAFQIDWYDSPDKPWIILLDQLSRHMSQRIERGDTEGLDRLFALVEQWLTHGDDYVSTVAVMCILEGLMGHWRMNIFCWRRGNPIVPKIEPWLGPASRTWWHESIPFWIGDFNALNQMME